MLNQSPIIKSYLPLVLFALLLTCIEDGRAEPKAPGGGDAAIKKAQGMIRQLAQEKSALEAEKTAWLNEKAELDAKLKALDDAVRKLQPLQGEVERYKNGLETVRSHLESQLGQERQTRQALLEKHNRVVAQARDIQSDNRLLVQAVQEREQWISQCGDVNRKLQTANQEILGKYQDKSLWQQLAELEPVTGIARVETETTVEDYRYKLQQLKITPFQAGAQTEANVAPQSEAEAEPSEAPQDAEIAASAQARQP